MFRRDLLDPPRINLAGLVELDRRRAAAAAPKNYTPNYTLM
jgi:hypothetical protein